MFLIWATAEPQAWAQTTFAVAPEVNESNSQVNPKANSKGNPVLTALNQCTLNMPEN